MGDRPRKKRRPKLQGFSIEVYPCRGEGHHNGDPDGCSLCLGSTPHGTIAVLVHPDGHRQAMRVTMEGFVKADK
jgi:hypothetical protein